MRNRDLTGRVGRELIAHAVHLVVLLLPTLALAGPGGVDWAIACFAVGITAAGVLESRFLSPEASFRNAAIRDKMAMRVSLFVGICLLAVFWSAQIERHFHGHGSFGWQAAGGSCLAIGIFLRIEAIRALGTQFVSDIRVGRVIVRDGIYAWLRHPSEIGLLLIAVGAPLLIGSLFTALAAATLLLPISLWRMVREDIALAA